jgi:hypothetical protein
MWSGLSRVLGTRRPRCCCAWRKRSSGPRDQGRRTPWRSRRRHHGDGHPRLAQNTNNLLGWKYSPGVSDGERDTWGLECPEKGTIDEFLVSRDRAEAVDFVADQLASSENYRADTERYRRDRASGTDVVEAANRWVDAIADPYSSHPRPIAPLCGAS